MADKRLRYHQLICQGESTLTCSTEKLLPITIKHAKENLFGREITTWLPFHTPPNVSLRLSK